MSFLVDPPLLVLSGAAIEVLAPDEDAAKVAGAAVLGTFFAVSGALYAHPGWGRNWMLNSGLFSFEHRRVGTPTHLVSLAIFATYPAWLRLGRRLARART